MGQYFSSGKGYKAKRVITYPEFDRFRGIYKQQQPYDIGLIELEESVYNENIGDYRNINTICLPERKIQNNRREPAYISGWGKKDSESYGQLKIANAFLNSGKYLFEIENIRACTVSLFPLFL